MDIENCDDILNSKSSGGAHESNRVTSQDENRPTSAFLLLVKSSNLVTLKRPVAEILSCYHHPLDSVFRSCIAHFLRPFVELDQEMIEIANSVCASLWKEFYGLFLEEKKYVSIKSV